MPKVGGSGPSREYTAERTYERVRPYFRRVGIERVVEVTGRDRVGIPVYHAVAAHSIDGAPGYGGKGLTPIDAKTSAVMEAFERHAGWLPLRPTAVASYTELATAGRVVLHPGDHNIRLLADYDDDRAIYWVTGYDLLNDEPVLVPHGAVAYGVPPGAPPCYELTTTNGLASGSSLEEAICHGLCELLERDALTISEVVGDGLYQALADREPGGGPELEWVAGRYPPIDLDTVPPLVRPLVARFRDAGLTLRLLSITSDIGVPSILARVRESHGSSSREHTGFGAHPDMQVALIRAITECAQERAFDADDDRPSVMAADTRASPDDPTPVAAASLPSFPSDDVVTDIRLMLDRLRAGGVPRAVAVDLSPPEIPVHVVRVLAPGLESWAIDHSKLGDRAAAAWNRALAAVRDRRMLMR